MTSVVLLEQLKAFTEKIMADMILPVAMQQGDTEQAYRAPEVYLMRLPDSRAAKKKAPYIIHRVIDKAIFQTKIMDFAVIGVKVDNQLLRSTEDSQRRGVIKGAGQLFLLIFPGGCHGKIQGFLRLKPCSCNQQSVLISPKPSHRGKSPQGRFA